MPKNILFKLFACFLLLAIFSVAQAVAQKKPSDKAKKLVKQADALFQKKDYRNAANKYAEAIIISPDYPYAHFWKGYAHYYLKEYDQAIADLDAALAQGYAPQQEIYKLRWFLNYEKKNYEQALKDVQEALKAEPGNSAFNLGLANIYRSQGLYKEAVDAYKKVLEIEPTSADVPYFMALSYSKIGDYQSQEQAAAEAVKKNTPFVGESFYLLGEALQKNKKYDEAIAAYQQAINAKPDIYEVYVNLPEIYRLQSRYEEAINVTKKGLTLYPNNGELFKNLSWYYSLADRHNEAVNAALNASVLLPSQSAPYTNLCRAYNDIKQYQKPSLPVTMR